MDISQPGAFAKNYKCPCCQNPWNQADSNVEISSPSQVACSVCLTDNKGYQGINPANFDNTVPIGENFFLWSNGGWKKNNPIPAEYSSWNTFTVLRDLNLERLKELLEELSTSSSDQSGENKEDFRKVRDFFQCFMNEKQIEKDSLQPLLPILELCCDITKDPTSVIAQLHSLYGVNVFFSLSSMPDKANSDFSIASLYQSGLGLPDRDYYFDADKADKRAKYLQYIEDLFELVESSFSSVGNEGEADGGEKKSSSFSFLSSLNSKEIAKAILAFETSLASLHLTRTASRDPTLTYNKMTINELITLTSSNYDLHWSNYLTYGSSPRLPFSWLQYFQSIGKSADILGDINLYSKTLISKFPSLIENHSTILPFYCFFHVINSFSSHLPAAFVNLSFHFYDKELKGTTELFPRWKRGLFALESTLGEALGKLYIAKYFPLDYKEKALFIVESVRSALNERLKEIEWMSNETKQEAFIKMNKFKVKIGFPDIWKDYSQLVIRNDHYHIKNVISSKQFEFQIELSRMNAPTDKQRWFMTPQTVNAYYHPSLNEIVFPAAILQPPFFDSEADLAVQYGSLGAVVGHEMTHGFDDQVFSLVFFSFCPFDCIVSFSLVTQGRKYDSKGNLRDWWTASDGDEYERRAKVMIQQAEKYEVYGLKLNGKLTCGENIADLGGVKLALKALQTYLAQQEKEGSSSVSLINGFTPVQRLFLAWSQSWRENVRKERAVQMVTIDPHGPNELRCNGTLSNIQEFYEVESTLR
jgi:putative endopeptidase